MLQLRRVTLLRRVTAAALRRCLSGALLHHLTADTFAQLGEVWDGLAACEVCAVERLKLFQQPAALLAQAFEHAAESFDVAPCAVAQAVGHQAAQGAGQGAVIKQIIGDLVEYVVGIEFESCLAAVPARIREPHRLGPGLQLGAPELAKRLGPRHRLTLAEPAGLSGLGLASCGSCQFACQVRLPARPSDVIGEIFRARVGKCHIPLV